MIKLHRSILGLLIALGIPVLALAQSTFVNGSRTYVIGTGIRQQVPNDTVTGTTVNLTAKPTSTGFILSGTGDTNIPIFIVANGAGITGNAEIVITGQGSCVMDTTTSNTRGFYVIASTTTAGRCHAQSAQPSGVWIIGFMEDNSTTAAATGIVHVYNAFLAAGGGGSTAWSSLTAPSGGLTLSMAGNASEFDYTSALANAFKWANTAAATSSVSQSSPFMTWCGQGWSGGTPANTQDCASLQFNIPNGANSLEQLAFTMSTTSTSGNVSYSFDKKIYLPSGGSVNLGAQGSRVGVFDQSGVEFGPGGRGLYFGNTGNLDAAGIDTGVTRFAAGVVSASNGSANNRAGLFISGNQVFVTSNFTTAANTSLQTITGLSWTVPATAINYSFSCHLAYSQATANAAVAFGIQAATNAPTNIFARGIEWTSTTAATTGVLATLTTTTATAIVSATPSATATNFVTDLSGTLELGASANTINIMVSTATSGDAVTVLRGSYCTLQ